MTEQLELPLDTPIDRGKMVKDFYDAIPDYDPNTFPHIQLVREEITEVAEAVGHLLKELADLEYVFAAAYEIGGIREFPEDIVANLNALNHYYALVPPPIMDEAFKRVHLSNMSKLVGGKLLRREDGKVLKGPNYKDPDLLDLV